MIEVCAALSDLGSAISLAAWAAARPARPDNTVLAISKCQSFFILFPVECGVGSEPERQAVGSKRARTTIGSLILLPVVAPLG